MLRGTNPALRDDIFAPAETLGAVARGESGAADRPVTMTVNGVFNKTAILLGLCVAAAIFAWSLVLPSSGGVIADPKVNPYVLIGGGAITGLILALITMFRPQAAPFTAPVYALAEGVFIGAVSALFAVMYGTTEAGTLSPNYAIVFQAAALTFGVLGAMLFLYRTGAIKVTRGFRTAVGAAAGAILLVYVANFLMQMFMSTPMPYLHSSGPIGIGISVVIIVVAALTLPITFEFITQGVRAGAPRSMEWYAGFSLLVSLVWLYLEILTLLAKLQGRD